MSSVLQQTLRGLCFDTGWCYAVFWKLKRQARSVLTWEDAFVGSKAEDSIASPSTTTISQQVGRGLANMEDPIALSVSKMSYHVYSVGEGIIGRIAFTNKHQWVFSSSDKGTSSDGASTKKTNLRMQPDKYPSGWDQQFEAGIKTIAVIAVPQGVVQLGSTRVIAEDLKLIGHVKALFGTLQNVPGAFLSDLVTEAQRSGVRTVYPMAVPAPQLSLARTPSLPATLTVPSLPENMNFSTASFERLPRLLAAQQQIFTHAHSMPSPSMLGFSGGVPYFQRLPCDNSGLESLSKPALSAFQPSCTWAGSGVMGTTPVFKPAIGISVTSGMKVSTPTQTGVIRQYSLSSKTSSSASSAATMTPFSQVAHSPYSTDSSGIGGKVVNVEESDQLRANPSPQSGVSRHFYLDSKSSSFAVPASPGALFIKAVHSPYVVTCNGFGDKGDAEIFEQPKANPPTRTGTIRNLSLTSKASSVAIPLVTGARFPQAPHSPYSCDFATAVGKGINAEDSAWMKGNPSPGAGVARHISFSSKASPAATSAPGFQDIHSLTIKSGLSGDESAHVEVSEQSEANHPHRTGIIRHLSLKSKASPLGLRNAPGAPFPQTINAPCSASSAATRSKAVNMLSSEGLRVQSKSTFRAECPLRVNGKHTLLAAESCDVRSFTDSATISTKEDSLGVVGRTWAENTQSMGCGTSGVMRTPVGVQLSEDQSEGRSFSLEKGSPSEALQADSSRHSKFAKQKKSGRPLFECEQMRDIENFLDVQQLDRGSHMVDFVQLASGPVSNELVKGGPQLAGLLPPVNISSLSDGPATKCTPFSSRGFSPQSEHFGGTMAPQGVYQFDKLSFQSSELGSSNLPSCSNASAFGGFPLSTSYSVKQESHERESGGVSAQVSSFACEEITSKRSYLTSQMSDLLELAQRFENADGDGHKVLDSVNVDSNQSLSCNLFDDYSESMQFLKPIFGSLERPAGVSQPTDHSIHNLFSSELDDFDEFFARLDKAEGKSGISVQLETSSDIRSNSDVSAYLNSDSLEVGKEKLANITSGSSMHVSSTAIQPLPDWVASEATLPGKEVTNLEEELQIDRFVNSQIYPKLSLPCSSRLDGDAHLSCQEMAALPPPASRQHEIRKKRKKRRWSGDDGSTVHSKCRQKMQERIQDLRAIVPDGARCGIDTLLERALEYASALQRVSEGSGKGTPSKNSQIYGGGPETLSNPSEASTSLNISWVVDMRAQEKASPVLVESLSQPGQMLVEMSCQEHAIFLKIADNIKRLGFTILRGIMEARSNSIWARFVIEGPKEIHRVQVLWSLMNLLGAHTES